MPEDHEQSVVRRKKLQALRARGVNPYPNDFRPDHTAGDLRARCEGLGETELAAEAAVRIAGRIVGLRDFGKAGFLHVQDRTGRIQVHARRDRLSEADFELYRTVDLGELSAARGRP